MRSCCGRSDEPATSLPDLLKPHPVSALFAEPIRQGIAAGGDVQPAGRSAWPDPCRGVRTGRLMRLVCAGLVATRPNTPTKVEQSQSPVLPAWPVVNDLLTLWDSIAAEQNGPELTDAGFDAEEVLDAIEQSL